MSYDPGPSPVDKPSSQPHFWRSSHLQFPFTIYQPRQLNRLRRLERRYLIEK